MYITILFLLQILGRPYYILTCASFITPDTLLSTLLSSLQSGSILTLQSIDTLPLTNQLLLMGYIKDIYEAIKVSMVVSPVFTKSPVVVNIPAGSRCESPGSTPSLNSHNDYKRYAFIIMHYVLIIRYISYVV